MSEYVTEHLTETQIIEDRIARACVTIREAWPHMLPTGVPGKRPGGGARSVGIVQRPESEADYHDTGEHDVDAMTRIASLRREVVEELAQWCRLIIEDRPVTATKVDGSDVQQMCEFVERHAQWLSGHRDAEEAAEITRLIAGGARVMVCGGRDMAAGVSAALTDILAPAGLTPALLKAQGRYVEDVY